MGIGGGQLLILVGVLVLLFIAPTRLPGLGKSLAQAIRGFRKGLNSEEEEASPHPEPRKLSPPPQEDSSHHHNHIEVQSSKD